MRDPAVGHVRVLDAELAMTDYWGGADTMSLLAPGTRCILVPPAHPAVVGHVVTVVAGPMPLGARDAWGRIFMKVLYVISGIEVRPIWIGRPDGLSSVQRWCLQPIAPPRGEDGERRGRESGVGPPARGSDPSAPADFGAGGEGHHQGSGIPEGTPGMDESKAQAGDATEGGARCTR